MSGLPIQHARWQGEPVTPDDTRLEAGAKCGCICKYCDASLILRRGKKNRPHFAHHPETSCGGETYIHKAVKAWIAEKLIGQTIRLRPHPELDSPQEFCVEKGWQEEQSKETKRRYDVVLAGMFLYEKAEQEKRGRLIFEVCYSKAKDDKFKLQTQKEGSYILEVDAKKFYGDRRENLTVQRLIENSEWLWPPSQQLEEQEPIQKKREQERIQNYWSGFDAKKNLYKTVRDWIAKELTRFWFYPLGFDAPFKECGLLNSKGYKPWRFEVEKRWQNKCSQKTGKKYDVVFEGRFIYRSRSDYTRRGSNDYKRGHLIFQLVDHFNAQDDDFKLQIQKAKICVLEVDMHGFYGDGLKPPTPERLVENSRWVW